ncbi:hypothetical protein SDC9_135712 [bioreactor metagenome]|uniref:Uncharacterized protein n=1 Tax=bioreactor metagenome TaxID=1076179 RepID=A0A645DHW8_9ZZZZ
MLARIVTDGEHIPAGRVALQRLLEECLVDGVLVGGQFRRAQELMEHLHPGVEVGGAVVAVNHRHRQPVGRRHDIDLRIGARQRLFHDRHQEDRRAGGYIARAGSDAVGGNHAGLGVTLGRAERGARFQIALGIKQRRAFPCQPPGYIPCLQHPGQDGPQVKIQRPALRQGIKQREFLFVIPLPLLIQREHAGGLAGAQHLFAREPQVGIALQRGQEGDILHMLFLIENSLIQVRHAPALGDVEMEQVGQFGGRLPGAGVAPGAESGQLPALFVKGQVAVHHRGYADAGQFTWHHAVALL